MDDHRFAGLLRRLQVQAERFLLQLCCFRLVVVIEAGFANRHHPRVIELLQQPVQRRRGPRLHIQRVHAHRAVDIVITFGQGLDVGRVVRADTDTQKVPYPTLPGSFQGSIQGALVGGQVKAIKVTMGIYEHKGLQLVWVGRSDVLILRV
ncbi:hypothetical protein D9M71_141010 [compost metagenome]